ncbi:uncharacterized protein LOC120206420 [Hibiscus syriacus]|uniref:uncharacterized protein LOC120206420 n=1 Tax=Hibiscus syriacus TaxID=106335 RepID=UPI0019244A00|nr:uncharacterized protein LOC120206420 [Hibiscus syriacus]
MTTDERCPMCNYEAEDINHMLRLCPKVMVIWIELLGTQKMDKFLNTNIKEWIIENIETSKSLRQGSRIGLPSSALLSGTCGKEETRNSKHYKWQKPNRDYCKINTDEAKRQNTGEDVCRGIARDHNGNWIWGFGKKIGICSILEA